MATLVTTSSGASAANGQLAKYPTFYRTIAIDGLSIFYREAGPKDGPTILLLHGLPSSSRMFEPLFDRLADRYHLVAPDYPGFGHSDWPNPKEFAYTFDRYAEIMTRFTEALAIPRYTLYMQDYGGPCRLSHGVDAPGTSRGAYRSRCGGAQRRTGSELENPTSVLGRPKGQRERASHQSPLASRHAYPPRGQRSQCRAI